MASPKHMPGTRKQVGVGKVCVWPGGSLWIGQATGPTDLHAHHAVQLSFAGSGALQFRSRTNTWAEYTAAIVPSDVPHAFQGENISAAHLFIEPESVPGRRILHRFGRSRVSSIPADISAAAAACVFGEWSAARRPAQLVAAAQEAIGILAGTASSYAPADPRVLRAIEIITERLDSSVTLVDVARATYISPSRLRHLFVEETGLPFRRYVLWQRLQKVFGMMSDSSLTEAAHTAGFADAAHMTRTFRRMLGIAPTSLAAD